jgi:hypothetical protein
MTIATLEAEAPVKVRFKTHFRGRLTNEDFYTAGMVGEFAADVAAALVEQRQADYAEPDAPVNAPAEYGMTAVTAAQAAAKQARPRPAAPPPVEDDPTDYSGLTKVRFKAAFRGRLTGEDFYLAGQVAALDPANAAALIANGSAALADPAARVSAPAERGPGMLSPSVSVPDPKEQAAAEHQANVRELAARLLAVLPRFEKWLDQQEEKEQS